MKVIYLLLILASFHTANGQTGKKTKAAEPSAAPKAVDYCSLIKKEVSDDKSTFDYSSPFDPHEVPPVRIMRSYSTNPEYSFDNFSVVLQILSDLESVYLTNDKGEHVEKDEKKVVIEFSDNSKITDDTLKINHDVSEDKTQSVRYVYFPITTTNFSDFSTKKIAKITLAGYEQIVPVDSTNSFQKYLECIKTIKK